jgi:hypothetical protein
MGAATTLGEGAAAMGGGVRGVGSDCNAAATAALGKGVSLIREEGGWAPREGGGGGGLQKKGGG